MQRDITQSIVILLHGDIQGTSETANKQASPKVIGKLEPKVVERVV
jgi:hypothetical protein